MLLINAVKHEVVVESATYRLDTLGRVKVVRATIPKGHGSWTLYGAGSEFHERAKALIKA